MLPRFLTLALFACALLRAQETRSMLFGRVLDPQGAAIAGVSVVVQTPTRVSSNP